MRKFGEAMLALDIETFRSRRLIGSKMSVCLFPTTSIAWGRYVLSLVLPSSVDPSCFFASVSGVEDSEGQRAALKAKFLRMVGHHIIPTENLFQPSDDG